jgi:hypothetical protein
MPHQVQAGARCCWDHPVLLNSLTSSRRRPPSNPFKFRPAAQAGRVQRRRPHQQAGKGKGGLHSGFAPQRTGPVESSGAEGMWAGPQACMKCQWGVMAWCWARSVQVVWPAPHAQQRARLVAVCVLHWMNMLNTSRAWPSISSNVNSCRSCRCARRKSASASGGTWWGRGGEGGPDRGQGSHQAVCGPRGHRKQ